MRIGRYTVTEVRNKASENYILPDPATFEVKTGETVLVQFFNEKPGEETPDKPTTPSTPQTRLFPSFGFILSRTAEPLLFNPHCRGSGKVSSAAQPGRY